MMMFSKTLCILLLAAFSVGSVSALVSVCDSSTAAYEACLATDICDSVSCSVSCDGDNDCCAPCAASAAVYKGACCAAAGDDPVDLCESSTLAYEACLDTDICEGKSCPVSCDGDNSCCAPCTASAAVYKGACCDAAEDEGTTTSDAPVKTKSVVAALLGVAALIFVYELSLSPPLH